MWYDVTMQRRLSVAGRIHEMIHEENAKFTLKEGLL